MKGTDILIFIAKIDDEIDELKDLKAGQQKVVPGLIKTRIDGRRWKLGVVLEKDED